MSLYWAPSAVMVSVTSSGTPMPIASASNAIEGLARFVNRDATTAFVDMVSANATAGDSKRVPLVSGGTLFIAYGQANSHAIVDGASVLVNAGYARL